MRAIVQFNLAVTHPVPAVRRFRRTREFEHLPTVGDAVRIGEPLQIRTHDHDAARGVTEHTVQYADFEPNGARVEKVERLPTGEVLVDLVTLDAFTISQEDLDALLVHLQFAGYHEHLGP